MAQFIVTIDDSEVEHYGGSAQMAYAIKAALHVPAEVEPYEDDEESLVE